jgi:O-antigen ligase
MNGIASSPRRLPLSAVGIAAAVAFSAVPPLVAFNLQPNPTFFNQIAALLLAGPFVALVSGRSSGRLPWSLIVALALVAAAIPVSHFTAGLPTGLVLQGLGLVLAAMMLVLSGASARGRSAAAPTEGVTLRDPLAAFLLGWMVAGIVSALIACVQTFAPEWVDNIFIARAETARAIGNLRQPNHLATVLLLASIAVVALFEFGSFGRRQISDALAALVPLMLALVLTGSRTGVVGVLLLAAWGAWDRGRQLSRAARGLLLGTPLLYALAWGAMWLWAHEGAHAIGGGLRLALGADGGDISSSRFAIWANALSLIRTQPLTGVGFGEFNLAWTLTPFPDRPTALFDHTHNLPLQLIVELGIPVGVLVTALLLWSLWRAWRLSRGDLRARVATMFVVMVGLHSLFEYPLWFAFFLLPVSWVWGYALGEPRGAAGDGAAFRTPSASGPRDTPSTWALLRFGSALALTIGAVLALVDYGRVTPLFHLKYARTPFVPRIEAARDSVLFGHIGDYAAAITGQAQSDALDGFDRAIHAVADPQLLNRWATALDGVGRTDQARYLVMRIREFGPGRQPPGIETCDPSVLPLRRFACEPPQRVLTWRDLVRP